MKHRMYAFLVLVTIVGLLAGCGGEPTQTTTGSEPGPHVPVATTRPTTFSPVWTDLDRCPEKYPVALGMIPETAEEVRILSTLDFCTGPAAVGFPYGKGFYLGNTDDTAVWVVDKPVMPPVSPTGLPTQIAFYHDFLAKQGFQGTTIEPHRTLSWDAIDPMTLHLRLDSSAQAAWQTLDLAVDAAKDKLASVAEAAAVKLIGAGSPTRTAFATCMLAGYQAGNTIDRAATHKVGTLEAALSLGGSTAGCGKAVHNVPSSSGKVLTETDLLAHARVSSRWAAGETVFSAAEKLTVSILKLTHRA